MHPWTPQAKTKTMTFRNVLNTAPNRWYRDLESGQLVCKLLTMVLDHNMHFEDKGENWFVFGDSLLWQFFFFVGLWHGAWHGAQGGPVAWASRTHGPQGPRAPWGAPQVASSPMKPKQLVLEVLSLIPRRSCDKTIKTCSHLQKRVLK